MEEIVNEPGNLILVEYTNRINEVDLNWGFKDGYFEEEKIPVLFIYSNFPNTVTTNRQSLVGSIRTHVEERKGIIFFPDDMKEDVNQIVNEALKKEKVDLDFHPYSGEIYNPDYLAQLCDTCFSIKNIKLKEVIKMAPKNEQTKSIHQEMLKNLDANEDKEVVCFMLDKEKKEITELRNMDQQAAINRTATFTEIVKDKAFKTRFIDLFLGNKSMPMRIKNYLSGEDWKFDNLLIFYSARRKRTFIQDLPGSAFFLNTSEDTFMLLNTQYPLVSYSYAAKPEQRFTIVKNNVSQRYDIYEDRTPLVNPVLKLDMIGIFVNGIESVNKFLEMITHTRTNECRFFFDKMCIFVKISGSKYIIETYPAK